MIFLTPRNFGLLLKRLGLLLQGVVLPRRSKPQGGFLPRQGGFFGHVGDKGHREGVVVDRVCAAAKFCGALAVLDGEGVVLGDQSFPAGKVGSLGVGLTSAKEQKERKDSFHGNNIARIGR